MNLFIILLFLNGFLLLILLVSKIISYTTQHSTEKKYTNEKTSKYIIFNYSIIYYVSCTLVKFKSSRSSQKIIRKSTYNLTSNTNVLCHLIFTHGINAISFYKITGIGKLFTGKIYYNNKVTCKEMENNNTYSLTCNLSLSSLFKNVNQLTHKTQTLNISN